MLLTGELGQASGRAREPAAGSMSFACSSSHSKAKPQKLQLSSAWRNGPRRGERIKNKIII
jgi:hypothetical protein